MPKGFKGIREAREQIEARRAKALEGDSEFTPSLWFKLPDSAGGKKDPEEITASMRAVIRPLEEGDEVAYAAVHPVKVDGRQWPVDIVCRDQDGSGEPCPGCEANEKRKLKGWINVIWRDAPDFPQDDNGKYNTKVDYESLPKSDKVAILSSGPELFGRLDELDEDLGGLTNYDLEITRKGLKLDTKYKIKKDSKSALSAADKKLVESKPDLSNFIRIPDYEEWQQRAQGNFSRNNDNDETTVSAPNALGSDMPENIFAR